MEECGKCRAGHDISFKAGHKAAKKKQTKLGTKADKSHTGSAVLITQDTKRGD